MLQESRHPRHAVRPTLLVLIAFLCAGCFPPPEPPPRFAPGEPLYDRFTSPGKRIVLEGPDGPTMKMRTRRSGLRVYDELSRPVGRVSFDDEGNVALIVPGEDPISPEWLQPDVAVLHGAWRVERADSGWDVFNADGELLALWRLQPPEDRAGDGVDDGESRWVARDSYGDTRVYTVDTDAQGAYTTLLRDPQGRRALATRAELSPLEVLAFHLTDLPPGPRATLARWATHHLHEDRTSDEI